MIAATAPQWPAKYSISAGAERVLVVTAIAPSSTQANQASIASMQLSRWIRHEFARLDAARHEPGGERADALVKFAVGPAARRRIKRRPDQEWMFAAGLGAHPQQPRHVEAGKWSDDARRRF